MELEVILTKFKEHDITPVMPFQNSREKLRIKVKSDWLMQNLALSFDHFIYSLPPDEGGNIGDINLLGNDATGERERFTICLYDSFMGQFTSSCPEIIGLVSNGESRKESLNNLCIALSEVTILNYEKLNLNPFTKNTKVPGYSLQKDYTIFSPVDFAALLKIEFGFTDIYLTDNNIIMKHRNHPILNLTIPLQDVNMSTLMVILKISQAHIGGSNIMEQFGL